VEWRTSCFASGRKSLAILTAALIGMGGNVAPSQAAPNPATPIQHLVVVFQENVSFDHYFGSYPNAANLPGESVFQAKPSTPTINGLSIALLQHNPNLNPLNGAGATNPFRLSPSQAVTADQDHDYDANRKPSMAAPWTCFRYMWDRGTAAERNGNH